MTALEPCPNPECGGGNVVSMWFRDGDLYHSRYRCKACGTTGAEAKGVGLDAVQAEARRLWNALPRAPKATTGFPSVPGWYWQYVPGHGWIPDYLDESDCREPLRLDHCTHIAGPLPEPAIPQPPTPAERSDRP